jgi:homoserine kinase type II
MPVLTELKKKDFEKILEKYAIGRYKSHKHIEWALQNTVYLVKTTKGKYILKMFELSDEKFIRFQIRVIDYLVGKKIPAAKISQSKDRKELLHYKDKPVIIQKFIEGSKFTKLNHKLMKDIAKKFSLMSKHLLKLKLNGLYAWNEHQFRPCPNQKNKILGIDFKDEEKSVLNQLRRVDREKLRRSVVHSDFHGVNILVKGDKLTAILDWDDCHEDYLAYEVAVFIMEPFIKGKTVDKKRLKAFFKEYQKNLKLRKEEKKAMYYFAKQRYLGVILWHSKQMKVHKDLLKRLKRTQTSIVRSYIAFSSMSLEEFLELF